VWCALPDGSTEFQNQRWLDYTGLSAEAARGWGWRDAIHPDDAESYMNKWLEIKASQASGEAEARFRRFDGEYCRFLMRVDPVRDERGDIVKWPRPGAGACDRHRLGWRDRREERAQAGQHVYDLRAAAEHALGSIGERVMALNIP